MYERERGHGQTVSCVWCMVGPFPLVWEGGRGMGKPFSLCIGGIQGHGWSFFLYFLLFFGGGGGWG